MLANILKFIVLTGFFSRMGRNKRKKSSPENRQHRYREGKVPDPPGVITCPGGSVGEGRTCTPYSSKDSEMA